MKKVLGVVVAAALVGMTSGALAQPITGNLRAEQLDQPLGPSKINGSGGHQSFRPYTFGTYNEANIASFVANGPNALAQVDGFQNVGQMSLNSDLGSVTLYTANSSVPPLQADASPTYNINTYFPSTPLSPTVVGQIQAAIKTNQINNFPVGIMITLGTLGSGTYYRGNILAVATDGTSVTVGGWYVTGNSAPGQVPVNGLAGVINPSEKIWNNNGVMQLTNNGGATQATYDEADMYNNISTGQVIGFSANCDGTFACSQGFIALGNINFGFLSDNPSGYTGHPFAYQYATGNYRFAIDSAGGGRFGDPAAFSDLVIEPQASGTGNVLLTAAGPDTNESVRLVSQGTGGLISQSTGHPYEGTNGSNQITWSVGVTGSTIIGNVALTDGFTIATNTLGANNVNLAANGGDTNVNLSLVPQGTGSVIANTTTGLTVGNLAALDGMTLKTNASGAGHSDINALGIDANIDLDLVPLGTGSVVAVSGTSGHVFEGKTSGSIVYSVGPTGSVVIGNQGAVDGFTLATNTASSANVNFVAGGPDANIDMTLVPKGTGQVNVPGLVASAPITADVGVIVPPNYIVPTTGQTITLTNSTPDTLLNPAGTLAALTIVFPTAPINGQKIKFVSSQTITSVTLTSVPNIFGNITTMTGDNANTFEYSQAANAWFRF